MSLLRMHTVHVQVTPVLRGRRIRQGWRYTDGQRWCHVTQADTAAVIFQPHFTLHRPTIVCTLHTVHSYPRDNVHKNKNGPAKEGGNRTMPPPPLNTPLNVTVGLAECDCLCDKKTPFLCHTGSWLKIWTLEQVISSSVSYYLQAFLMVNETVHPRIKNMHRLEPSAFCKLLSYTLYFADCFG